MGKRFPPKIEILKSQLATQFIMYNNYNADVRKILQEINAMIPANLKVVAKVSTSYRNIQSLNI